DITLDDMNDAFGKDQTYYTFTFDPCSDATLGLLSCPLFSFSLFPKLETMIMLGIEKSALTGSSSGHCYGMSLGSERFQRREARYIDFAPYSAHSGWQLSGPAGASPELDHYLRILSVSQLCTELISYWLRAAGKIWASSSDFAGEVPDIRAAIAEDLIAGNYPLLALRQGGTGHVVVATDLEDGDAPGVAFYVYIYDPNVPFLASEQTNADEHKLREAVYSRITVYQDGRWMYQKADGAQWGPGYFHSRDYSLVVIPYHAIPLRPSLPGLLDIPRFVLDVVFGDAEITQIAHADGRYLYHPDGTPNGDAGTRLPDVAPFAPFLGAAGQVGAIAAPQMYFLGYPGAYTQIVRNGGGAYTASVMSSGFSATAERGVVATPSVDALTFHAGAGSFGMQSSGPGKPVKITLACTAEDGSARTAMVETVASGGAGIQVAFDQGRDAFEYRHDGENATLNVTLGWAGPGGLPRTFAAPALLVVPGEMAILRPVHWPALHSAGVELAIYHRNGSVERRNLPPAEPRPAPVVITELEVEEDEDDSRNARRLEIHLRRTSQDSDLVALVAWVVLRNRQVVARHTITLSGGQLSPGDHQRSWRFIPPAPGPYEFVGTVTTLVRAIPADSYLDRQSTGFVVL
ncbi:MAG: hypothetical protein JOZ22_06365, partial [Acidobacteriia bacterium]|nr:hypothetical protein [Terriglobia bacterium]